MKFIKKIIVSIIAIVMSVGLFSFAACDQGNDGSDNNDNPQNIDGGDKDDDIKTILTEDTDFEALVSEKVTAEQWSAAFADGPKYSNYTLKCLYEQSESTDIYYMKYQTVEDELYVLQSDNHSDVATYMHCFGGSVYAYAPGFFEDWELILGYNEDVDFDGGYEPMYNWITTYRCFCADFGEFFDRFTYNDKLGQYEFVGNDTDYISTNSTGGYGGKKAKYFDATVKIINGRLAYVKFGSSTCYFYDFNNSAFDISNL